MAKVFEITDKKYEPGHEPLVCTSVSCENELTGQQRKYCSEECRVKVISKKACKERKGIYKDLDGWAGGPRGLTKVESSIKHNETHVTGNGAFVVDDYHVDPDIFAIAEANHEQYVLDRNEYEARVVIDGLEVFIKEYNKHHETNYATEQSKKQEANLTEDQRVGRSVKAKEYQEKNKERIRAKQKANYYANLEKYRKRHRDYYHKNKCLKKKISGS